jgi:hypothetical protein
MESSGCKTRRSEGAPPPVACGKRGKGEKASHQIPGIYVQHKLEKAVSFGIQTLIPLRYDGIHGRDNAQKLFDRQAGFTKIYRSVRVPGVKGEYYEDSISVCLLADFIMPLKSKVTSKQLLRSLNQAKRIGT